jgi:hypothetical protein
MEASAPDLFRNVYNVTAVPWLSAPNGFSLMSLVVCFDVEQPERPAQRAISVSIKLREKVLFMNVVDINCLSRCL